MRKSNAKGTLYDRIRQILDSAKTAVARSVNTTQVVANWLVGREIVEEEQKGKVRAAYGVALLQDLSARLTRNFDRGWSVRQLEYVRSFYLEYGGLLNDTKSNAVRAISGETEKSNAVRSISDAAILHAPSGELGGVRISEALRRKSPQADSALALSTILYAPSKESWRPGKLYPNLSWTHYRTLLRVDKPEARAFYEIEAIQNNWAARELGRPQGGAA